MNIINTDNNSQYIKRKNVDTPVKVTTTENSHKMNNLTMTTKVTKAEHNTSHRWSTDSQMYPAKHTHTKITGANITETTVTI